MISTALHLSLIHLVFELLYIRFPSVEAHESHDDKHDQYDQYCIASSLTLIHVVCELLCIPFPSVEAHDDEEIHELQYTDDAHTNKETHRPADITCR